MRNVPGRDHDRDRNFEPWVGAWFEDSAETETTRPSRLRLGLVRDDTATETFRDTWQAETSPWRVETAESHRVTPNHPESTWIFIIFTNF